MLSKIMDWLQPRPEGRFTQPDLDKGETLEFNFSGTKVSFKVEAESNPEVLQRELNLYNTQYYSAHERWRYLTPPDPDVDIPTIPVCVSGAGFAENERNGRGLGGLRLVVQVYHNPRAKNLFNKAEMEQAALDVIDVYYGPFSRKGYGRRNYEAPLFWEIKQPGSEPWIFYYINERGSNEGHYQWLLPLSNQHFLMLNYQMSRVVGSGVEAACVEFMENFAAHFTIDYSPDAQKDKQAAEQANPDAAYSPTRPSQKWEAYDLQPFLCMGGGESIERSLLLLRNKSEAGLRSFFKVDEGEHPLELVDGKLDPEYALRLLLMRHYHSNSLDYSIRNIEERSASDLGQGPYEDQPKSIVDFYLQHKGPWPDDLLEQYEAILALQDELKTQEEAKSSGQ